MNSMLNKISRPGIVMAVIGIVLLCMTFNDFIISFKSPKSFDDVIEGDVKVGDHVKGRVPYLLDYFAIEQTWTENKSTNSTTPKKTSKYYYVVPSNEKYLGLTVNAKDVSTAKKLADQTYGLLSGGAEPTAELMVDGRISKMDDELKGMFIEYLKDGDAYSDDEISAMGVLMIIEPRSFSAVRIMFAVGVGLTAIGVLLFIKRWKKFSKLELEADDVPPEAPVNPMNPVDSEASVNSTDSEE